MRGRNALTWEDKLALDVEYVDTQTLVGDLRLLVATLLPVLRRDGISATGDVTMPEFMGTLATPDASRPGTSA